VPLVFETASPFQAALSLVLVVACSAGCQDRAGLVAVQKADTPSPPPLEISFQPSQGLRAKEGELSCEVPHGRSQVYDPQTGTFHIHFRSRDFTRCAFEVTKATGRFTQPVVFRFTGVPSGYGCLGHPLTLSLADKRYAIDGSCDSQYYWTEHFDKALFRSQRDGDVVTVEFTEKGQSLLKPGAKISLEIDTGW
jgi:hypothetical protein